VIDVEETDLDTRVGRLDDRVKKAEADIKSLNEQMDQVHAAIAGINERVNIRDIQLDVEKAHTSIYKWIASALVSSVVIVVFVFATLR